jgi:hypothetical protein
LQQNGAYCPLCKSSNLDFSRVSSGTVACPTCKWKGGVHQVQNSFESGATPNPKAVMSEVAAFIRGQLQGLLCTYVEVGQVAPDGPAVGPVQRIPLSPEAGMDTIRTVWRRIGALPEWPADGGLPESSLSNGEAVTRLRGWLAWAEGWEPSGGTSAALATTPAPAQPTLREVQEPHHYVFRLETSECWSVCFGTEAKPLRDSQGLQRIVQLISSPGKQVSSLELMGSDPSRLDVKRSYQEDLDPDGERALRQRAEALRKEYEDAQELGNDDRKHELWTQLEPILQQLIKGTIPEGKRPAGKERRNLDQTDPAELARKAARKSINDAIQAIRNSGMPTLAEHLKKHIKLGRDCSYQPLTPAIPWEIDSRLPEK